MSGLGALLNIAGSALSAHKYGVEVTANNIANVDTPGYTRQTAQLQSTIPETSGNLIMGRGVEIESVISATDQFVEKQLSDQKTNLAFYQEQNNYVERIEQLFSPSDSSGISSTLSAFWNSWQEVANNPSGTAERVVLADDAALLTESFNRLDQGLDAVTTDLDDALQAGVEDVNVLTREIAGLNQQILKAEAGGATAHTLRDQRNTKLGELAEYMEISTFETDDGSLTVMGAGGNDLVRGNHSFDLSIQNDRIMLAGSGTTQRDITDAVQNGKMGGWLDMRDNVVAGYQQDLDDLSHALIWQVNAQHSQGAGLSAFDAVTGTYGVENTDTVALADGASGLAFSDKIDASGGTGFKFWVYDDTGEVVPQSGQNYADIAIDSTTTLEDLVTALNGVDSNITASITNENTIEITGGNGYSFAFSEDTSNVLAALGINTFFAGETAGDMAVNGTIQSDSTSIAAGYVQADGSVASGDNTNAMAIADLQSTRTSIGTVQGRVGQLETTTENYYYTMLSSMGTTFSGITSKMETSEVMVQQLSDMRESISGVSLDEEMVNLMSYQSAYASAAKLITTADEMMDTLLGIR